MNQPDKDQHDEDAIVRIGMAMAKMRLMVGRRYIGRRAISRAGSGLELTQYDAILLVNRMQKTQEITVGTIAENMHLDHSRASRIVKDLVERGYLRRDVSQEDARRTIVALTDAGREMVKIAERTKRETLTEALADWSEEDMERFADLYYRFMQTLEKMSLNFDTYADDKQT